MEQLANFLATGTLNMGGTLSNSATTITLTSTSPFPSSYPFRVAIEDEILKVTANAGTNQWTVVRGDGGTTAVSHADGSTVASVLTKEALDALIAWQQSGTEQANRRIVNIIGMDVADDSGNSAVKITNRIPWEGSIVLPPAIGSWTWVNQGSATATTTSKGSLFLASPATSGDSLRCLVMAKPGTNWTAIMRFETCLFGVNYNSMGFLIRDSSSGKIINFAKGTGTIGQNLYTNPTTYSSTPTGINNEMTDRSVWWKFVRSGTTITWYKSVDGESWIQILSYTVSGWLTSGEDQIGIFSNSNNATYGCGLLLNSWQTSSP